MRSFIPLLSLSLIAAVTAGAVAISADRAPQSPVPAQQPAQQYTFMPPRQLDLVDAITGQGGLDVGAIPIGHAGISLADTLSLERRARLWWDYARDVGSVTSRLQRAGETTLLVPVDAAVMRMSRKPHQNPSGEPENDDEARNNVAAFLLAHIVPAAVEMPSQTPYQTLLSSLSIRVVQDGDGFKITPGDIAIVDVKQASNGRIMYLDGVLPY
ncbi:hypothetical protein Q5752_007026 [Cryptotrichosporon argae]